MIMVESYLYNFQTSFHSKDKDRDSESSTASDALCHVQPGLGLLRKPWDSKFAHNDQ